MDCGQCFVHHRSEHRNKEHSRGVLYMRMGFVSAFNHFSGYKYISNASRATN